MRWIVPSWLGIGLCFKQRSLIIMASCMQVMRGWSVRLIGLGPCHGTMGRCIKKRAEWRLLCIKRSQERRFGCASPGCHVFVGVGTAWENAPLLKGILQDPIEKGWKKLRIKKESFWLLIFFFFCYDQPQRPQPKGRQYTQGFLKYEFNKHKPRLKSGFKKKWVKVNENNSVWCAWVKHVRERVSMGNQNKI